jgi:hypothetical protein
MTRAAFLSASLAIALAAAAPCAAGEVATARAQATIVEPANILVNWALAQPTVQGIVQGAEFVGTMPALGIGLTIPGNARLIIRREDDTGAPVTAPGAFEVTSIGHQALLIRTGGGRFGSVTPRTIAGGELLGGTAASIDVARGLILADDHPGLAAPQTLVVVVQYN